MTTVLIVDDQPLIRRAVREILADGGINVIGEAADGEEAVTAARELRPDVVLMDIRMPVLDGIAATARIRADATEDSARVLVLTTFEEDDYVLAALRAGASGFIGKSAEPEDIVHAVRTIHDGDALLSPAATRALIERVTDPRPKTAEPADPRLIPLTPREREVLQLVGRGLSNAEIADDLTISLHTAKTHVNRTMMKVHAGDRAQLVILAYETGLVHPGSP
ncbi:response regulator transcription factor [Microbacterium gorillae]|uniref:response regulator transcription factor n=1 Tax=Microbacterium gorillae TaxID=1231063 RepID=UPI003D961EF3